MYRRPERTGSAFPTQNQSLVQTGTGLQEVGGSQTLWKINKRMNLPENPPVLSCPYTVITCRAGYCQEPHDSF